MTVLIWAITLYMTWAMIGELYAHDWLWAGVNFLFIMMNLNSLTRFR